MGQLVRAVEIDLPAQYRQADYFDKKLAVTCSARS